MTANRLCDPQSKLGIWERWRETVYLPGSERLTKDHFYEALDRLHAHAVTVEEAVFLRTVDLLKLDVDTTYRENPLY